MIIDAIDRKEAKIITHPDSLALEFVHLSGLLLRILKRLDVEQGQKIAILLDGIPYAPRQEEA